MLGSAPATPTVQGFTLPLGLVTVTTSIRKSAGTPESGRLDGAREVANRIRVLRKLASQMEPSCVRVPPSAVASAANRSPSSKAVRQAVFLQRRAAPHQGANAAGTK